MEIRELCRISNERFHIVKRIRSGFDIHPGTKDAIARWHFRHDLRSPKENNINKYIIKRRFMNAVENIGCQINNWMQTRGLLDIRIVRGDNTKY